jgi:hypothetical protein
VYGQRWQAETGSSQIKRDIASAVNTRHDKACREPIAFFAHEVWLSRLSSRSLPASHSWGQCLGLGLPEDRLSKPHLLSCQKPALHFLTALAQPYSL